VNLPAHSHGVTDPGHAHGVTDPGHAHGEQVSVSSSAYAGVGIGYNSSLTGVVASYLSTALAYTGVTVNSATTGITTQNTGSGTLFSLVQPTIAAYVFIYAGV
jgi:hypothetical protein